MANDVLEVDPRKLLVPRTRQFGSDPIKLRRQIRLFGASMTGMPMPLVSRGKDGKLMILDGVTRATRIAKESPGTLIKILVTEDVPAVDHSGLPSIGDFLP